MTNRRWVILGILAFLAVCITFSDKQRLRYMYEAHIAPIFRQAQTSSDHNDGDQTDEYPQSDTAIGTD